jgi:hypothetical protein
MLSTRSIASLAQRLERSAVNRKVVGSIPTGGAFLPFLPSVPFSDLSVLAAIRPVFGGLQLHPQPASAPAPAVSKKNEHSSKKAKKGRSGV